MLSASYFKYCIFVFGLVALVVVYVFLFGTLRYKNLPEHCYSPNHKYYLVTHQDIKSYLLPSLFGEFGSFFIYDEYGNLLYETRSSLDLQGGPYWTDRGLIHSGMGISEDIVWQSPSSPGIGQSLRICY